MDFDFIHYEDLLRKYHTIKKLKREAGKEWQKLMESHSTFQEELHMEELKALIKTANQRCEELDQTVNALYNTCEEFQANGEPVKTEVLDAIETKVKKEINGD